MKVKVEYLLIPEYSVDGRQVVFCVDETYKRDILPLCYSHDTTICHYFYFWNCYLLFVYLIQYKREYANLRLARNTTRNI